jgi:hypothetical protein
MELRFGLLILILTLQTFAAAAAVTDLNRPGYLTEVQTERDQRFYEIFIFAAPPAKEKPLLDIIFNEQLSREFKEKYRERFGQLDTSTIVYQPTKFSIMDENRGAVLKIEIENTKRKEFGEFMVKRLIEWHVDNYFKTEPSMRPVYELKEKLSHVQVEVTKTTKLNAQYSFSDNSIDLIIDGPHFDSSKITLLMDPKQFGPGPVQDEKLYLTKALSKKLTWIGTATAVDGIASTELVRTYKSNWSTSIGTLAAFKDGGPSPRETKYMVGLGHSY